MKLILHFYSSHKCNKNIIIYDLLSAIGTWRIPNGNATSKYLDCDGGTDAGVTRTGVTHNVVTHNGNMFSLKSVELEWQAPVQVSNHLMLLF
jgi:hypothetical protein